MSYVDGYVLPVPKKKVKAYQKIASLGGKIWRKHGALDYKECVLDDGKPDMGGMKIMTFAQLVKPKPGETVIFSYILFKSRKHRDQVNAKVMKDPAMAEENFKDMPMPFDMKRMTYGGFESIVDA